LRGLVVLLALALPGCGVLLPPPLGDLTYEERPFGYVAGRAGFLGGAILGAVAGGGVTASFGGSDGNVAGGVLVGGLAGAAAGSLVAVPLRFLEELVYVLAGWDQGGRRPGYRLSGRGGRSTSRGPRGRSPGSRARPRVGAAPPGR
jgi:hypothetical protein